MDRSAFIACFSPPLCVACRLPCSPGGPLCDDCLFELNTGEPVWGDPPPGLNDCTAAFRHDGVARSLLHAFKFGGMSLLAPLLAGYMAENLDSPADGLTIIPVPSVWVRRIKRGFDPASLLAVEVARNLGDCSVDERTIRRSGFGRQRGGGRDQRIASPPDIRPGRSLTGSLRIEGPVLLVDDVITTGATVATCAAAVRRLGAGPVSALGFTRRV